jgi:flavorubredoxin
MDLSAHKKRRAPTKVTAGPAVPLLSTAAYALGATVSHKSDIHWVPAGCQRDVPLNCFLLVEGRSGMIIDTSFPVVGPVILEQAQSIELDDLQIVYTRAVEYDSVGNADLFVDRYEVSKVWSHFASYEWVYLRTMDPLPFPPPFDSCTFGADGPLSLGPARPLQTINAKLRLLAAAWVYDPATRILFTSDSFSHVMAPEPGVRVVTLQNDTTTVDDVHRHLLAKFNWMQGANTAPLAEFVTKLFDSHDIEQIAPSFGCVIRGRDLVCRHKDMVLDALKKLDGENTYEQA